MVPSPLWGEGRSEGEMEKEELLNQAEKHIFSMGLGDSGSKLCKANMKYGLAKIHYWQESLGITPKATFISTPDMTVTRNVDRWRAGFGYGGKVSWGEGDEEVIILNTKPNTCGMLVGGLEKLPGEKKLLERAETFQKKKNFIQGIRVKWDFSKGNHFIEIFSVKPMSEVEIPFYVFIIHGSAGELKKDSPFGWGLYYDKSSSLRKEASEINTPFGPLYILEGKKARRYFKLYQFADTFSKKRRELAARELFGDYELISNETHQGLLNYNEILLGCHYIEGDDKLYPLTLRADLPAYLLKGHKNLRPESIENLGFGKRARKLGVYQRLRQANLIPHGGGYTFPQLLNIEKVYEIGSKRYFRADAANDRGKQIIFDIRDIPFVYRGREVALKMLELGLGQIAAKLIPLYGFKV